MYIQFHPVQCHVYHQHKYYFSKYNWAMIEITQGVLSVDFTVLLIHELPVTRINTARGFQMCVEWIPLWFHCPRYERKLNFVLTSEWKGIKLCFWGGQLSENEIDNVEYHRTGLKTNRRIELQAGVMDRAKTM